MRTIKQTTHFRCLAALVALTAGLAALPLAASEQWFVLSMGSRPVGYLHEAVSEEGDTVVVGTEMRFVLNRLESKVEAGAKVVSRERADGSLVSVESELDLSAMTTTTTAVVEPGRVRLSTRVGAQTFEQTLAFSGALLGPEGVRKLSAAQLASPGDAVAGQIFSPDLNRVSRFTRTVVAREALVEAGRPVETLKVEEVVEGSPTRRTLWLDREGQVVATAEPGPFGEVRALRSDAATARRAGETGGELPADVYSRSILRTRIRLPQARRISWLKLELTHRNPSLGWPELNRPGQRVTEQTRDRLVLEISRPPLPRGLPFPVPATAANRELLAPNAYLQSEDPALAALARSVVGDERDLMQAALKLERWVAESMTFDAGIVLAPSVEIFRDRRGTCAGYAMLLATLLRSAGIPARYVLGYVYLDGMFGGHAWVEVLAGDAWIPLDATVVAPGVADAARLAFQDTSLAQGVGALNAGPGVQMYGQIDLRVLAYAVEGGAKIDVDPSVPAYTVEGDRYRNAHLGIELTQPAGFRFAGLDAVWPEPALLRLEGPRGQVITLETRRRWPWETADGAVDKQLSAELPAGRKGTLDVAGEPAALREGGGKAALAAAREEVVWILVARGDGAGKALREVAAGLRW